MYFMQEISLKIIHVTLSRALVISRKSWSIRALEQCSSDSCQETGGKAIFDFFLAKHTTRNAPVYKSLSEGEKMAQEDEDLITESILVYLYL